MGDTTGDTGSINALHDICEKHEAPLYTMKVDFWTLTNVKHYEYYDALKKYECE